MLIQGYFSPVPITRVKGDKVEQNFLSKKAGAYSKILEISLVKIFYSTPSVLNIILTFKVSQTLSYMIAGAIYL